MTEPAKTFEEYANWVANQGYWIDGLQWKALAERLERNVVIFKRRRSESIWQRFLVTGKANGKAPDCKLPPILLVLKLTDSHYRTLLKPSADTATPALWLQETSEQHRSCVRGAAPKTKEKMFFELRKRKSFSLSFGQNY